MPNQSPVLTDAAFLAAFLDGSLPAAAFDHVGHLRAAWLVLTSHPVDEAISIVSGCIAALAARQGVPDKFHYTLTAAMVRIIADRMRQSDSLAWSRFLSVNADLLIDARAVLRQHYSDEVLTSAAARTRFVAPDRLPWPA